MLTGPPVMWTGQTCCGQVKKSLDSWSTEKKINEQNRSSEIIYIVSYALKMGANGCHTCGLFQVIKHTSTGLHIYIHDLTSTWTTTKVWLANSWSYI